MGVLDFPGLVLSWLDGTVAGVVPDVARIVLWGVLAGIVTMSVYARASQQGRLAELKRQSYAVRADLAAYDGDFSGAMALAKCNLRIAMVRLRLSLLPAMFAGLPMLVVAVWMSGSFAYERPADGARVGIVSVSHDAASASGTARVVRGLATVRTDASGRLAVVGPQGSEIASLPAGRLSDTIQPWYWWNLLIGNPAGYLPAASPVAEVSISLRPARFLPAVPGWMAGWEFLFLVTATLASLVAKTVLRLA